MARRGRVELALGRSVRATTVAPESAATVELAKQYARAIDEEAYPLWRIGPRFLETLDALGLTPRAKAALLKGQSLPAPPADPIDELRRQRERRRAGGA